MKNLNQIRALHALEASKFTFKGEEGGEVVKKVPAMIQEAGLLGALAFAIESNAEGYKKVLSSALEHCQNCGTQIRKLGCSTENLKDCTIEICKMSSIELRVLTNEIMAYLSFLRRFAKKD